jgi:hypothetical protein
MDLDRFLGVVAEKKIAVGKSLKDVLQENYGKMLLLNFGDVDDDEEMGNMPSGEIKKNISTF